MGNSKSKSKKEVKDGKGVASLKKVHSKAEINEYEELEELKETFARFDSDGSGKINLRELGKALELRGIKHSDEELKKIIDEVDKDKDKEINFEEFKTLMKREEGKKISEEKKVLEDLSKEYEDEQAELAAEAKKALEDAKEGKSESKGEGGVISLGPIIGKVTDTTARILIETHADGKVTCLLNCDASSDKKSLTKEFKAGSPAVFQFEGLHPQSTYEVKFEGAENKDVTGSFRTYSPTQTQFVIVAAACDKGPDKRGKTNMFEKLYTEYIATGRIDLLVRHGDQVYADLAFKQCELLLNDPMSQEDKDKLMANFYRNFYRRVWNAPDVKKAMANIPTLMLWDDHEIRNDWGTFKQDTDKNSKDYKIARFARKVYWEYQRQLWDDIGAREGKALEAHVEESKNWLTQGPLTSLSLTVVSGDKLIAKDAGGVSDPYVKVEFLNAQYEVIATEKSKVIKRTLNPKWNFTPKVKKEILDDLFALRIQVWDHDAVSSDDFMGEAIIPLRLACPYQPKQAVDATLPLKPSIDHELNKWNASVTGALNVKLTFDRKAEEDKRAHDREEDCEGSFHVFGNYGLILLDGRGARSFSFQKGEPPHRNFIGTQQWHKLKKALAPDGLFKDVTNLAVVHSMAPILMSTSSSDTVGYIPPQVDKMGFGLHPQEQTDFLHLLDDWAVGQKKNRKWVLVGGDMHFGVLTDIKVKEEKGSRVIGKQMITSAISNSPPPAPVYWMLRRFMKGLGTLGHPGQEFRYLFNHEHFYNERNFGLIVMRSNEDKPEITPTIITGDADPPLGLDRAC